MSDSFPHLFSPIAVGPYTLKNRIMNTGHAAHFQTGDGLPTRRYVDYLAERAKPTPTCRTRPAKGAPATSVPASPAPRAAWGTSTEDGSVDVYNVISWQPRTMEGIDTVVFASGGAPDDSLGDALAGRVPEVHVVGDCYQPRDIEVAVVDGHRAGRAIGS